MDSELELHNSSTDSNVDPTRIGVWVRASILYPPCIRPLPGYIILVTTKPAFKSSYTTNTPVSKLCFTISIVEYFKHLQTVVSESKLLSVVVVVMTVFIFSET